MRDENPRAEDPVAVVHDINQLLWEHFEKTMPLIADKTAGQEILAFSKLSFGTDGTVDWIDFLGLSVWDSENDERPWDETGNARTMTLRDFVQKTMARVMRDVNLLCAALGEP